MSNLLSRVVNCIAITTRYPKQLLTPDADLENDLGIDSVKRVEIVAALADEFQLDLISQERDPSIRTIQQVANWIEAAVADPSISTPSNVNGNAAPVHENPTAAPVAQQNQTAPVAPHNPAAGVQSHSTNNPAGHPAAPSSFALPNQTGQPGQTNVRFDSQHSQTNGNGSHYQTPPATTPLVHSSPMDSSPMPHQPQSTGHSPLAGRVAFVTGSGRGVGKTIARLLASRGATVIVNSFHSRDQGEQTTAEINASGGRALHIWGSVANPEHVDNMFAEIEQRIGYLDILVCNASDGKIGSFTDISQADWDRGFRTNVSGHHQCAVGASRLMERRGGGSIVTMSSIASHSYVQGMGGQGVIKAAVESMTRYLACELAPIGVRTNCVSGGPVYGDLLETYPQARATHNYWERVIPDGQMCSPMDLAGTIAFLVSDEARAINGAIWTVDHGASTRAHSRPLPQLQANGQTSSSLS